VVALLVVLVAGTAGRLVLLFLRPNAAQRFRDRRRARRARQVEQCGDAAVLVTAVTMIAFGFGHHPGSIAIAIWATALLSGFAAVYLAHEVARRHRRAPAPGQSRVRADTNAS